MKKLFTTAAVALFMLSVTSCSDDDSKTSDVGNDNIENVLVKKTVEEDEDGDLFTCIYTYTGNKLATVTEIYSDDTVREVYTYKGNLISKIERFKEDGELEDERTLEYNSDNQLIAYNYKVPTFGNNERHTYTYNADNTIKVLFYDLTISETEPQGNTIITFINGNVTKRVETSEYGVYNTIFTYDNKKNPFKNIIGNTALKLLYPVTEGVNNTLTEISYSDSGFGSVNTTYTYNSNDYPIESVNSISEKTTYFYE